MPTFRTGEVVSMISERRGLQRVAVSLGDPHDDQVDHERAYVLTQLTGPVAVGDRVVVNTTAVELGLGTGGWHVVHWNLERDTWSEPGPGHIMKLRYTSLQVDTGAGEEHVGVVPSELDDLPVVVCTLHSQMAIVAATIAHQRPGTRVVYVMTDGAALPIALSDLVDRLVELGMIDKTVTAGHAFGGDLEAVTVASALAMARHHLAADVVIVSMGPGVVGTNTHLGTTSIEAAAILDTVSMLGGTALFCPRMSGADPRPRHRGLSHHSRTVLDLAVSPVLVPWTVSGPEVSGDLRHTVLSTQVPDVAGLLARSGLTVKSMGRGVDEDPLFFDAAAAAGVVAAARVPPAPTSTSPAVAPETGR